MRRGPSQCTSQRVDWTQQLVPEFKQARSVDRGKGPPRQSAAFQPQQASLVGRGSDVCRTRAACLACVRGHPRQFVGAVRDRDGLGNLRRRSCGRGADHRVDVACM